MNLPHRVQGPRRWPALALLALLLGATALCGHVASGWRTDNRPTLWIREGPDAERYERFVGAFGSDETVRIRLEEPDAAASDDFAAGLGPRLQALVGDVGEVLDPFDLPGGSDPDRPLVRELGLRGEGHVDWILSLDNGASPERRADLAQGLRALGKEARESDARLIAAGHPLLAAALDEEAKRVERVFVPLLVLFAAAVMALVLRSFALALLSVLVASLASLGTRAGLALVGWDANLVLVAVGPLVLVLVLAATLHLVTAYRRGLARGLPATEAARGARRDVLPAALLATLTTALGFGVFATSAILPVQRLGIAVALAVSVAVPLAYLILPPLFAAFAPRPPGARPRGPRFRALAVLAARRRGLVLFATAAIFALGLASARALEPATNALDYFPTGHPVRAAFLAFEESGTGLSTVEVLVPGGLDTEQVKTLEAGLAAVPGVQGVFGPGMVRRDLRHLLGPAARLGERAALLEAGRTEDSETLLRFTIQTTTGTSKELEDLTYGLRAVARTQVGTSDAIEVTGSLPAVMSMQAELVDTLARSLALTLGVVTLLFLTVVRTAPALGAVLVTNLFPVALVLGASLLLDWRLDAATTMVAAVVLGLAVDNTLHLAATARRLRGRRSPRPELRAFQHVGEAALISSFALAVGFSTLALSGFAPTAHFGTLVGLGALGALVADLVVLPALWIRSARGSGPPSG